MLKAKFASAVRSEYTVKLG